VIYKVFFIIAAPVILFVFIHIHTQSIPIHIYMPYMATPAKVYQPLDMVDDAIRIDTHIDTRVILSVHTPANTDPLDFTLVDANSNRYDQSLDSTLHKIDIPSKGTLVFIVTTNTHDFKLRYKDEYETAIHV